MVVAQNMNNSTLRSILTSEKLTRPTIMSWHRNLRIALRSEKKLAYLEQPLIPTPVHMAPSVDYEQFVQNYNMHNMGKIIVELHAMLKLTEKGIPKKVATPVVLSIRGGKIQKDKNKPQGAKGQEKGKTKLAYALNPKIYAT
ncbi:hypothetical protein Tco_1271501 [Tanacetum coccineum]